jgi:hypothetical protein
MMMIKLIHSAIYKSNTVNEFESQGIRQKLNLVPVTKHNINNIANNTFPDNNQILKEKIICEAYGCSRKAATTIVLEAGTKKVTVYICDKCKSKFE